MSSIDVRRLAAGGCAAGSGFEAARAALRALLFAALVVLPMVADRSWGVCCPIPCFGCGIRSSWQIDFVVMDREHGRVRLVPDINFVGLAPDFALVVPTPALPDFALAPSAIWTEASQLTSPTWLRDGSGGGCQSSQVAPLSPPPNPLDGVIVHGERTIGSFQVTIVSSDDPTALVIWLDTHGFALAEADAARFAPYVQRQWYFTVMRRNPADTMPPEGWNAEVEPVEISYAAQEFELPLPILAINRASWMPVFLFAVDDHRTTLEGFATTYANRITANEYAAIAAQYPALAAFVAPGRFLTLLGRTFTDADAMERSLVLQRAPTDEEYRPIYSSGGRSWDGVPAESGLFVLLLGWVGARRRRRR